MSVTFSTISFLVFNLAVGPQGCQQLDYIVNLIFKILYTQNASLLQLIVLVL